jgi:hypothetical protein
MPTFFAGNVLPPPSERTSNDPTFRFSQQDAEKLQLVGKPIRLEHEESLTVGTVVKQMKDRTGRVFVVGRIDAEDTSANHRAVRVFADRALESGLYQSLSLQHEHTENLDGSNPRKSAVEVSLVNEPRRPNCDIGCVRRRTAHAASAKSGSAAPTENTDYIGTPAEPKDNTTITSLPPPDTLIPPAAMSAADNTTTPAAPAAGTAETAAAPTEPLAPAKPSPAAENTADNPVVAPETGDTYKTADIVNVVVEQVRKCFIAGTVREYCVVVHAC